MTTTLDDRTWRSVAAYDEHARAYQEALRLLRPRADLRRFAAFTRRGDLVLDAGCGPANDLRLLRDIGVHPVGVDLSLGALREARLLLPRHPLVRAPLAQLPFRPRVFGGLWMSGAFTHLPRSAWQPTFKALLGFLEHGPVYFSCYRGNVNLAPVQDDILGDIFVSAASEQEVESLFEASDLVDLQLDLRPDPIHDRKRPWIVALAHRPA